MGAVASTVAVKELAPTILKGAGKVVSAVIDPLTGADEAKKKQQQALDEMKRQQAEQENARKAEAERLAKGAVSPQEIAPAIAEPTPPGATATPAEETAVEKRKRINALRMGMSSTIRTSAQGVLGATPTTSAATAKAKLGL